MFGLWVFLCNKSWDERRIHGWSFCTKQAVFWIANKWKNEAFEKRKASRIYTNSWRAFRSWTSTSRWEFDDPLLYVLVCHCLFYWFYVQEICLSYGRECLVSGVTSFCAMSLCWVRLIISALVSGVGYLKLTEYELSYTSIMAKKGENFASRLLIYGIWYCIINFMVFHVQLLGPMGHIWVLRLISDFKHHILWGY